MCLELCCTGGILVSIDVPTRELPHAKQPCPGPLPGLTGLTYLKLNDSKLHLGGHGWDVGDLTMLRHFDITKTMLGCEVEDFKLGPKGMKCPAPQLLQLVNLQYVDISNRHIGAAYAGSLAECLSHLT